MQYFSIPLFFSVFGMMGCIVRQANTEVKTLETVTSGESKHIVAEARVFYNEKINRRAILVDMIHIGLQSYYDAIIDFASGKISGRESEWLELSEGLSCQDNGKTTMVGTSVDWKKLPGYFSPSVEAAIEEIKAVVDEERMKEIASEAGLKSIGCGSPDMPALAYKDTAQANNLVTQIEYFNPNFEDKFAKLASVNADANLMQLPAPLRLLFFPYYACEIDEKCIKSDSKIQMEAIKKYISTIFVEFRNAILLDAFDYYVNIPGYNIILPWGEAHMKDLYEKLASRGFALESTTLLPVLTCEQVLASKDLRMAFDDQCTK